MEVFDENCIIGQKKKPDHVGELAEQMKQMLIFGYKKISFYCISFLLQIPTAVLIFGGSDECSNHNQRLMQGKMVPLTRRTLVALVHIHKSPCKSDVVKHACCSQ